MLKIIKTTHISVHQFCSKFTYINKKDRNKNEIIKIDKIREIVKSLINKAKVILLKPYFSSIKKTL